MAILISLKSVFQNVGGGEQNSKGLGKLAIVREALKSGNEFETAENFKRNFNHLHQRKFIVHLFHHRFIK